MVRGTVDEDCGEALPLLDLVAWWSTCVGWDLSLQEQAFTISVTIPLRDVRDSSGGPKESCGGIDLAELAGKGMILH